MLKPHSAEHVFGGMSGTVDEHMKNVMEGEGHADWRGGQFKEGVLTSRAASVSTSSTPMPDIGSPKGYAYGVSVLHEAGRQTELPTNAMQAVSWIHQKNSKPRTGRRGTK